MGSLCVLPGYESSDSEFLSMTARQWSQHVSNPHPSSYADANHHRSEHTEKQRCYGVVQWLELNWLSRISKYNDGWSSEPCYMFKPGSKRNYLKKKKQVTTIHRTSLEMFHMFLYIFNMVVDRCVHMWCITNYILQITNVVLQSQKLNSGLKKAINKQVTVWLQLCQVTSDLQLQLVVLKYTY